MTDDVTKRANYFDRQFLRAADMQVEQAHRNDRRWRHNRDMHTQGVSKDPLIAEVAPSQNSPGTGSLLVTGNSKDAFVTVQPGMAIDSLGEEMILISPAVVNIPKQGLQLPGTFNVYAEYSEQPSDPSGDPGITGNTRISEAPVFKVAPAPPNANKDVLLASVSLDGNGALTAAPTDLRAFAGTILPPDLLVSSLTFRYGQNQANWPKLNAGQANEADLAGSLKATGSVEAQSFRGDGSQLIGVVKEAGDTMTGPLNLPSNGLVVGTSQLVANGGNIGVGTASPTGILEIDGVNAKIKFGGKNGDAHHISSKVSIVFNSDGNGFYFRNTTFDDLSKYQDLLRITSTGTVGVGNFGTTLPSRRLHVHSDDSSGGGSMSAEILASGSTAGLSFMDRGLSGVFFSDDAAGNRWVWYSTAKIARLWASVKGDLVTIDGDSGNLTMAGQIIQEGWTAATLQNGWANYGAGYNPAGYFVDKLGIVHLRGLVQNPNAIGPNGSTILQLPAGYRPPNRELHAVQTNNNTIGRCDILNTGEVIAVAGSNVWFSLDGITFRVAQGPVILGGGVLAAGGLGGVIAAGGLNQPAA